MSKKNTWNPGAVLVADAIGRLPDEAKESVREAQKLCEKRQREWVSEMKKEFVAAQKENRPPVGKPCPPPALATSRATRVKYPSQPDESLDSRK